MKRDGRTLDHETLEEIRLMAVQRVWEGERPSVVIASYGFARPVIYRWLREARGKGRGLRALRSRKGTGRPRRLTPKQEQQLFRWINGKDPRQHGFDFGLWTRLVVRKLIADKFGVNFGVTAVGKLLARLGLTPQKPLNVLTSAILLQLKLGRSTPIQALQNERKSAAARFISGMNPDSAPMWCRERHGACEDKPRSYACRVSASRSRRLPPSMPEAASGSRPTKEG